MSTSPPLVVADRYRLVAPLGQGGMGRVWRATDVVLHRDVAIKELVPPPGLTPDERQEMRERSLREARAIARLNNINVVRVFDVLRTDADPWIVMEYVPSRSLQDILATDGPFNPVRAAEIGLGVLGALRAAHRAGVVHRDVKPGNVLIGEDGRVVLTDFGLATVPGDPNVTRTGLVLGSPAYIAPERARDGTAGPGADLWSLGATLYAAVEGASPFARPSAIATLAALATENPPPARNAGPLKPVLNGLLRKDPAHRINADEAERLLLRATGRRSKLSFPMSPTMRRPGVGRERPPVVPGVSASAPVVPGPRPPITSGRPPITPGRAGTTPPAIPGRAAAATPPVTPGRTGATSGRASATPPITPGRSGATPPAATGRSGATPPVAPGHPGVTPAGRSPVTSARASATPPTAPARPPIDPAAPEHRPQSGAPTGRAPIFTPGKATVGRSPRPGDAPTRIDPKNPAIDQTQVGPPAPFSRTGTAKPPPPGPEAGAEGPPALDATMRGAGSALGSFTVEEVAAARRHRVVQAPTAITPPQAAPAPTAPPAPTVERETEKPEPTPAAAARTVEPETAKSEPTPAAAAPTVEPETAKPEPTPAAAAPTAEPETAKPEPTPAAQPSAAAKAETARTSAEVTEIEPVAQPKTGSAAAAESPAAKAATTVEEPATQAGEAQAAAADGGTAGDEAKPGDAEVAEAKAATSSEPGKTGQVAKPAVGARAGAGSSKAGRKKGRGRQAATPAAKAATAEAAATSSEAKIEAAAPVASVDKRESAARVQTDNQVDVDKPVADTPAGNDLASDKSASDKSASDKSAADKAAFGGSVVGGSAADEPAGDEPVAEESVTDTSAASEPAADSTPATAAADERAPSKQAKNGSERAALSSTDADAKHADAEGTAKTSDVESNGAKDGGARDGKVSGSEESSTKDSSTQDSSTQDSSTRDSRAVGSASKGSASKDSASKGSASKDSRTGENAGKDGAPKDSRGDSGAVKGAASGGSTAGAAAGGDSGAAAKDDATVVAEPYMAPRRARRLAAAQAEDAPVRTRVIGATGSGVGGSSGPVTPVSGAPGLGSANRPAWQPMDFRAPSGGRRGLTVFGVTLTRRQTVIGFALLAAVLLLVGLLIPLAFADDGDGRAADRGRQAGVAPTVSVAQPQQSTAAAPPPKQQQSSAAPSAPASSAPADSALPKGWRMYGNPRTGFSVPVPDAASVDASNSDEIQFRWGNRLLLLAQTDQPAADPMADWKDQEASRSGGKYRNYERIRMVPVDYFQKAVDWEFLYTTSSGNRQHAVKRNFLTGPKQAYSINWYTSPEDWDAAKKDLQVIYDGFKPLS